MPVPKVWLLNVTLPAGTTAGTPIPVTITVDPQQPAENFIMRNYMVDIKDLAVASSPGVDYILKFVKKDVYEKARTPPVSNLNYSNPAKPNAFSGTREAFKFRILPNEKLSIFAIPLRDVTTEVTHSVTAFVDEYV
ncbi:MAG: hypothetical protein QW267_06660 [Sulfolobales archaeon]